MASVKQRLAEAIEAGATLKGVKSVEVSERRLFSAFRERPCELYSCQLSPDGRHVAVGGDFGGVDLLDFSSGESEKLLTHACPGSLPVMSLRFSTAGERLYTATAAGLVTVTELGSGKYEESSLLDLSEELMCMDLDSTGSSLVTGGSARSLRVHDVETGALVRSLPEREEWLLAHLELGNGMEHSMKITAARFFRGNNKLLVSAGWDNRLIFWDLRSANGYVDGIPNVHVAGDGLDLSETELLTACWTPHASLCRWDLRKRAYLGCLDVTAGYLYSGRYVNPLIAACGGSGDDRIHLVNLEDGSDVTSIQMDSCVQCITLSGDQQLISAVSAKGQCIVASLR